MLLRHKFNEADFEAHPPSPLVCAPQFALYEYMDVYPMQIFEMSATGYDTYAFFPFTLTSNCET